MNPTCKKCGAEKIPQGKKRVQWRCLPCQRLGAKRRRSENPDKYRYKDKRYRSENPEKYRDRGRRYRSENPEKVKETGKRWRSKNPQKQRWYLIFKTYGLTQLDWLHLFASQGYACGCCGSPTPGHAHGWAVEHCHTTKKIRGITCHWCNLTIGFSKESIERLKAGIAYLERHAD